MSMPVKSLRSAGSRSTRLPLKLKDRVAIVTGGTAGIGFGIAKVLLQQGAKVAIVGRDRKRGKAATASLRRGNRQVIYLEADVANPESVQKTVDACVTKYGRIDIICNNAAIKRVHKIVDMPVDVWDSVIDANLRGPFLFAKYGLPYMKPGGSVINIGSIASLAAYVGGAAYCSSKSALAMFTKVLALESAESGIRANCIVCGAFPTQMFYDSGAEIEQIASTVPLGRVGGVEEVGRLVAFLASDESAYMTGSVLVLDGGLTAGRG
jgi:dihydroanticapsin dehydrogenase